MDPIPRWVAGLPTTEYRATCPAQIVRRHRAQHITPALNDMPHHGADGQTENLTRRILTAIRHSPESFRPGGAYLDETFSVERFRLDKAQRLHRLRSIGPQSPPHCSRPLVDGQFGHRRPLFQDYYLDGGRVERLDHRWKRRSGEVPGNVPYRLSVALDELAAKTGPQPANVALAACILTWLVFDPEAEHFEPLLTEFQRIPWEDRATAGRVGLEHGTQAGKYGLRGIVQAAHHALAYLVAIECWPSDAHEEHPPSTLSPKALDGAAAALLRDNPQWSMTRLAHELGVRRQRFYELRLPILSAVRKQLEMERVERKEQLREDPRSRAREIGGPGGSWPDE